MQLHVNQSVGGEVGLTLQGRTPIRFHLDSSNKNSWSTDSNYCSSNPSLLPSSPWDGVETLVQVFRPWIGEAITLGTTAATGGLSFRILFRIHGLLFELKKNHFSPPYFAVYTIPFWWIIHFDFDSNFLKFILNF